MARSPLRAERPRLGRLRAARTLRCQPKAGALARCSNLEVPAQGLFYQANPKFTGTDQVAYTVKNADGRTQSFTLKINVSAQAKPEAKSQDNTDL
jgi:hypothetical protein